MKIPPLEKEVKFFINDPASFEERLRRLGASVKQPRTHELNYRFDTHDLDLTHSHKVLRIRKDNQVILAYKGPALPDSELRIRTEIELVVDDFDNAVSFLEALGYSLMVQYEKWRTIYLLNDLEITVDELPYGHFSEIEGEEEIAIRRTAATLGLNWGCRIDESYLALYDRVKSKLNLPVNNLTFAEFKNLSISPADLGVNAADIPHFL